MRSFLRLDATLFDAVRRLTAQGAHTLWPPSRSSVRAPSGFRCGGKGNMSTRRFFGARTRRNGRSKSNGASIGASRRSQGAPGTPSPLARPGSPPSRGPPRGRQPHRTIEGGKPHCRATVRAQGARLKASPSIFSAFRPFDDPQAAAEPFTYEFSPGSAPFCGRAAMFHGEGPRRSYPTAPPARRRCADPSAATPPPAARMAVDPKLNNLIWRKSPGQRQTRQRRSGRVRARRPAM